MLEVHRREGKGGEGRWEKMKNLYLPRTMQNVFLQMYQTWFKLQLESSTYLVCSDRVARGEKRNGK